MAKRKRIRESKSEKVIRKKRQLDYALQYGTYGYPYMPS